MPAQMLPIQHGSPPPMRTWTSRSSTRLKTVPSGAATLRFPKAAGWDNAMRWMLTAEQFDTAQALRIGIVQEVVPDGTHVEQAIVIAQLIAARRPRACEPPWPTPASAQGGQSWSRPSSSCSPQRTPASTSNPSSTARRPSSSAAQPVGRSARRAGAPSPRAGPLRNAHTTRVSGWRAG
ncbi:enoyl-CoA hydratase-related protein [Streptomyces sp. NPDC050287]|uniref:enoyl-CoA hydratase-related protein n=1 Tax=Streptomyces sp. NPDC050287 TaxID=3365608 RepID=UPI0037962438